MAFLNKIIKLFKNDRDVYYSEGDIKIGLQLDDYIKIVALSDTKKAQNIENYIKVGEEIYGNSFTKKIKNGEIDVNSFWKEIKNRISQELKIELDIDNLDSSILDELKKFYQKIDEKDTIQASIISKQILTKIGVNDNSLSLYHYLEYEIYKSKNNNKKAFNALEKAINLCFSHIYLSTILYFTQGILKRPDLAFEQFEKYYSEINANELTEELLFNICNFFLSNKHYKITIEICERVINQSNFEEDNIWKYYFLSNLVNAKISSFQIIDKEDEVALISNLKTIFEGFNKVYGENNIYLAKAYYSNYSMYYKKKFDVIIEGLKIATAHNAYNYNSLFDDSIFIKVNFEQPNAIILKAKYYINKVIEIKRNQDELNDLGQTISNSLVIYLDEIKLKELFKWKIKHICEQCDFNYSSEIILFNEYTEIETNLKKIEEILYSLPEFYPTESYELSHNLTLISDNLKSIFNKNTKLIKWCYKKALETLPKELKKEDELYLYLKKVNK